MKKILVFILCLLLVGCSSKPPVVEENPKIIISNDYFSIELPDYWKEHYVYETINDELGFAIVLYESTSYQSEYGGHLMTISLYASEEDYSFLPSYEKIGTLSEFENTYHVIIIEDINVDLVIKNTVDNTGKYSIGPENFEFILVNEETGETQKTVTDKEGNAKFNLVFTEDDIGKTYQYNLSIVKGKIEGLKYSNQTYDVKITISLNEDNDLVATIFVNGKEVSSVLAEFLNIYHIEPEQPTLPPTVDTTNNIPYITMMIISGGGLLLIMFLYNSKQNQYAFATATDITRIVPVTDYQEPDIKKRYSKKEKAAMTSDEIYDMIVSKRKKKTTKK